MPMDEDFSRVADRFLQFTHTVTRLPIIICDDTGTIVKAVVKSRVGSPHAFARRIVAGEFDEYAVTAEQEAADPRTKEGCNCLIQLHRRRLGSFGIAGPIELTRPLAQIAAMVIASWIHEERQRRLLRETSREASGAVRGLERRVAETGARTRALVERMTVASHKASEEVARSDGVAQTVHQLSQQSHILSINGSVEAVRAGDAGRAFGVVAREMLDMAEGARKQAQEIQATLAGVRRAIDALGGAIGDAGQATGEQLAAMTELVEVVSRLQAAVASLADPSSASNLE
jgi:hypothetical protein